MAVTNEMGEMDETLRSVAEQARELWGKFATEVELERRLRENPMAVLGVAAAAGFILGGGLWPAVRPFVRATVRAALTPANLLAIGAAVGALRAAGQREEIPAPQQGGPETH
jgi:hypothetical protein